jgi:hypothetical protein
MRPTLLIHENHGDVRKSMAAQVVSGGVDVGMEETPRELADGSGIYAKA